jgi:RNA polymerase sigma-70 factor (ECF subfamily)
VNELDTDDRGLVLRIIRHRDEHAFAALYTRHTTYLYRLALRLTAGDDSTSQDLVHEAWMSAVTRFGAFEWRSALQTWLAGFVVNAWRANVRRAARELMLDSRPAANDDPLSEHFPRADLERALGELSPGYREVLVLHDIEGYTHEEIAMLLGIEPGTSKSQLSRARAAIRRMLRGTRDERNL